MPDSQLWATYGVKFLAQVITESGIKPFSVLKEESSLPQQFIFRYLQLRHAVGKQLTTITVDLQPIQVLSVIFGSESAKLISNLYYALRLKKIGEVSQVARTRWEGDVGPIGGSRLGRDPGGGQDGLPQAFRPANATVYHPPGVSDAGEIGEVPANERPPVSHVWLHHKLLLSSVVAVLRHAGVLASGDKVSA